MIKLCDTRKKVHRTNIKNGRGIIHNDSMNKKRLIKESCVQFYAHSFDKLLDIGQVLIFLKLMQGETEVLKWPIRNQTNK